VTQRIDATVEGLPALLRTLEGLSQAVRGRIVRAALNAAAKILQAAAKPATSREAGLLRKSMARKVKIYRGTGRGVGVVGPRVGAGKVVTRKAGKWKPTSAYADPTKYAHLVEGGVKPHRIGNKPHPGVAPRPFLAPAVESQAEAVRSAMADEFAKGLAKAATDNRTGATP
jgi:HK97 gp10 family phage protein